MTHEEKLLAAINFLQSKGNTEQEACNMIAKWLYEATNCAVTMDERAQRITAIIQLRKLPHGQEILEAEKKRV